MRTDVVVVMATLLLKALKATSSVLQDKAWLPCTAPGLGHGPASGIQHGHAGSCAWPTAAAGTRHCRAGLAQLLQHWALGQGLHQQHCPAVGSARCWQNSASPCWAEGWNDPENQRCAIPSVQLEQMLSLKVTVNKTLRYVCLFPCPTKLLAWALLFLNRRMLASSISIKIGQRWDEVVTRLVFTSPYLDMLFWSLH